MAFSPRLELRQSQSLVMTPQLQQAIKMLQLSNHDLIDYVEAELERNPLLERNEDNAPTVTEEAGGLEPITNGDAGENDGDPSVADTLGGESFEATDAITDGSALDLETGSALANAEATCDTDMENLYPDAGAGDLPDVPKSANEVSSDAEAIGPSLSGATTTGTGATSGSGAGSGGDDFDPMANIAGEVSLKDHLTEQMHFIIKEPGERVIASTLIDLVDEAGYLTEAPEEVAERLGAPVEAVDGILEKLYTLDPCGVFARGLAECLTLQLRECGEYDEQMQALMANLHLIANHDLAGLARACDTDKAGLAVIVARIKQLNPKPGFQFGGGIVQPLVPDVFVKALPDGSWAVELNAETLPKVLVDQSYYATVARSAKSAPEKTYLSDCLQDANWLVKSLDQRARTILKVSREIVRQQDAFLTLGVAFLRPLNLKTVADAIEMHESTVSRVTANKYLACQRGTFEMKYFFSSSISASDGGDALSAEAVRHKLKLLIDDESPEKILSDDRLVELLRLDGVDIARRTVAKYREAMNIPSSVQRRRAKRAYA